jgi:hypothetical protein
MKINKIIEHEDGSATIEYSLNKQEEKLFKQLAKTKKVKYTKKFLRETILEAIELYVTCKELVPETKIERRKHVRV